MGRLAQTLGFTGTNMQLQVDNWATFIITLLGAFGGWAVVVATLLHFLGDTFAKRALQREAGKISEQLAGLSHELSLRESSYAKHLDLLLEYYAAFYRHYRLCQNATNQDAHRMPDGTITNTRKIFFEKLDDYLSESRAQEGKARLVLPHNLMLISEAAIDAFNEFKDAMKREKYDDTSHKQKREAFARIHAVKEELESGLRAFLRTEHLLRVAE